MMLTQFIVDQMGDAGFLIDANGRFCDVNEAACRSLGYSRDALLELSVSDVDPSYPIERWPEFWNNLQKQQHSVFESNLRTKTGHLFPVEIQANFISFQDEHYIFVFVRDISQRLENAKTLRFLSRFRKYFELGLIGMAITSMEKGWVEFNYTLHNTFGYTRDEFAKLTWTELTHPDDLQPDLEQFNRVLAGEIDGYSMEKRFFHKDGSIINTDISVKAIRKTDGSVDYFFGLFQDITERKQAEEKLKNSERKSRAWLEHSPACTKIIDLDLNLQYMSNAGVIGLGISDVRTLYGKPYPFHFYPESFKKTMTKNLEKAIEIGEILEQEAAAVDVDGGELWFHSTLVPVKDDDGKVDYITVVSIDTTKRKKMESQLRQAHKMEAIGTLAGGSAHDFNNILGVIMGFTEIVLNKASPEEQLHKDLSQVLTASSRARDLVAQLLTFSRISDIELKSVLIGPILKETMKFLRATLPTTIEIQTNLISTDAVVLIDPTQFHQILMNLCTNAAHAMKDSGGRLEVTLETLEVDQQKGESLNIEFGTFAKLDVSDTGTGIEPALMDRLFDPFFTTKEVGEGTGLGLSVVHGVVKDCHGAIEANSQVGQGTTFSIYLPLERSREAEVEEYSELSRIRLPIHFMLVDDEAVIAELGKRQLEGLGISTETFTSPQKALAGFNQNPDRFDGVMSDLIMPGMTGLELIQRIHESRPGLTAILCTGKQEPLSSELFKQAGVTASLKKPVLQEDLARLISDLFGGTSEHLSG